MANNTTTAMNDIVTCGICLDYYRDPRLLPCSHTYCYNCIKQLITNGQFACPLRDGTIIDQVNIDKLPMNRTATDMVEFLSTTSRNIVGSKCDNCTTNQCEYWCSKCESLFCATCSKIVHSPKALQSHSVVSAKEKPLSNLCLDHPDEKTKYWCTICEALICRDCLLFKHKNHTFVTLQDVVPVTKSKIQSSLQPIKQDLEEIVAKIGDTIVQQEQHYTETKANIDDTFLRLYQSLDLRKAELIRQIDENRAKETSILNKFQSDIDEQLKVFRARDMLAKQIFETNDNIQIMKMSHTLFDYDKQIREQYQRIDQECTFLTANFNEDTSLQQQILTYGAILTDELPLIRKINRVQLNLSRSSEDECQNPYELDRARGYIFQLKTPIKICSVQVKASIHGSIFVYIINDEGMLIKKTSLISDDTTMKWTTIPIFSELKDNYSLFVFSPNVSGKFAYKSGDNSFRPIDNNCSVQSKDTLINADIPIGTKLDVWSNRFSIEMMIDIEQQ